MNNERIKEIALANGFKLKEQPNGEMDLNPYVYDFAIKLAVKQNVVIFDIIKSLRFLVTDKSHKLVDNAVSQCLDEIDKNTDELISLLENKQLGLDEVADD